MATAALLAPALTMDQNNTPAWGSYLYQNFLLPAFSPNLASQWLTSPFGNSNNDNANNNNNNGNNNNNAGVNNQQLPLGDYFGSSWQNKSEPTVDLTSSPSSAQQYRNQPPTYSQSLNAPSQQQQQRQQQQQQYPFYGGSIPTSLLTADQQPQLQDKKPNLFNSYDNYNYLNAQASGSQTASGSAKISPLSIEAIDELVASPSPILSSRTSPHQSPKKGKRRAISIDSNDDGFEIEQDHEVPEGVERDGMIWGMKVENYRALSARERKRVRNRISARTFRAKRKEHLNSLESTLNNKDNQIRLARDDAERLRREVENLKRRLSKYEQI